jgi:hypothetical protein
MKYDFEKEDLGIQNQIIQSVINKSISYNNKSFISNTPIIKMSPLFFQNKIEPNNNEYISKNENMINKKSNTNFEFHSNINLFPNPFKNNLNLLLDNNNFFFNDELFKYQKNNINNLNSFLFPNLNLNNNNENNQPLNNENTLFIDEKPNVILPEKKEEKKRFVNKKRKRNEETKLRIRKKAIKKLDKTLISLKLNQIQINKTFLINFPAINIPEEEVKIDILFRLLNETNYFKIINNNQYLKFPLISEDTPPILKEKFLKEKNNILDLFLIEENLNETNPIIIIKNYYKKIKETIYQIQKNYVGKKKLSLNKEQCEILEKLILSCNDITNIFVEKKKGRKSMKFRIEEMNINKINNIKFNNNKRKKAFKCEFCNKIYYNGQGLGGHISRIHPNQSLKYKIRIKIRKERNEIRKRLFKIRKKLFIKYNKDYELLLKNNRKQEIKKFLLEHKKEYRNIKRKHSCKK